MGSIYFICYSARYYLFWIFCILCWCLWTLRGCPQTSFSVFPTIFRYFSCRNKVIYIFYFVQCKLKQIYRCKCSVIIWPFTFSFFLYSSVCLGVWIISFLSCIRWVLLFFLSEEISSKMYIIRTSFSKLVLIFFQLK